MKNLIACGLLFLSMVAVAETCPSVSEIQHNQLGAWKAFNANSGEPLSPEQLMEYEKKVNTFAEAAYYDGAPEGPAQCYYDGEGDHYHLDTYLARYKLFPDLTTDAWQKRSQGNYACQRSLEACVFLL